LPLGPSTFLKGGCSIPIPKISITTEHPRSWNSIFHRQSLYIPASEYLGAKIARLEHVGDDKFNTAHTSFFQFWHLRSSWNRITLLISSLRVCLSIRKLLIYWIPRNCSGAKIPFYIDHSILYCYDIVQGEADLKSPNLEIASMKAPERGIRNSPAALNPVPHMLWSRVLRLGNLADTDGEVKAESKV
jgi:hypothetical protein